MTTTFNTGAPAPGPAPAPIPVQAPSDHRGSWIPTWGMVTTRFMELRRRRGLMLALIAVNIGIPVVFLAVRLISHAVAPKSYGPAGGYSIFTIAACQRRSLSTWPVLTGNDPRMLISQFEVPRSAFTTSEYGDTI